MRTSVCLKPSCSGNPGSIVYSCLLIKSIFIGRKYVLEKQDDPGVPVDMEAALDAMGTFEFRLLREGLCFIQLRLKGYFSQSSGFFQCEVLL